MSGRRRFIAAVLVLGFTFAQTQEAPTTCQAGFRLFDHESLQGEPVCIPENPQRVVALEMSAAELTLFTDKAFVGTSGWVKEELLVMLPELTDAFEGVETYGYPAELEAVLLAKPDLILAVPGDIDVAAASKIAPVVLATDIVNDDWEAAFSLWSDALNVRDVFKQLQENYSSRIAELQEALGPERAEIEVSVLSASSYGTYLWLIGTAPGKIIADVGFARPPSQNYSGEAAKAEYGDARVFQISDERLDMADGDEIFTFTYATADPEFMTKENAVTASLKVNPLWQALSGVKAGHAYYVGGHWWRAQTYLLASKVIDDLFTYFVGEPSATPALSLTEVAQ